MFADDSDKEDGYCVCRYFYLLFPITVLCIGGPLAVSVVNYTTCEPLSKYLLTGGTTTLASFFSLASLRYRKASINDTWEFVQFATRGLVVLGGSLASFILWFMNIDLLFGNVVQRCGVNYQNDGFLYSSALVIFICSIIATPLMTYFLILMVYSRLVFMKPVPVLEDFKDGLLEQIRYVRSKKYGDLIQCLLLKCTDDPQLTIMYCHGNATDMGVMVEGLQHLARHLSCYVLIFEYPGYGLAADSPASEDRVYDAAQVAYSTLQFTRDNIYGVELPQHVILYGRSLGTAVAVNVAYTECQSDPTRERRSSLLFNLYKASRKVAHESAELDRNTTSERIASGTTNEKHAQATVLIGVILESPPTSILRTQSCWECADTWSCDVFATIDKIQFVHVPVHITHGEEDRLVPISHGRRLHEKLPQAFQYEPMWIPGRGHNDMPKFWLYNPNVANPEERKKVLEHNDENRKFVIRLRHFYSHCVGMFLTDITRICQERLRGSVSFAEEKEEKDRPISDSGVVTTLDIELVNVDTEKGP